MTFLSQKFLLFNGNVWWKSSIGCCLQKAYRTTLLLAYQSFGVVYGDLCISPIYVYKSTFSGKLRLHEEDVEIFGVLSLVFWTLTLIALFKYIIFVLGADDNGEGAFVVPDCVYCTLFFLHLYGNDFYRWDLCLILTNVPELKDGTLEHTSCRRWALNCLQAGTTPWGNED